jgi:hypothetical protein
MGNPAEGVIYHPDARFNMEMAHDVKACCGFVKIGSKRCPKPQAGFCCAGAVAGQDRRFAIARRRSSMAKGFPMTASTGLSESASFSR